ncbi:MAG: NADH-quinone oxidoreductase subunit A [Candidatus Bathyarchaeia archaeon]
MTGELPELIYLAAFAAISLGLPVVMVLGGKLVSPRKPNPVKESTFECGETPTGVGHPRFLIQYFAYAIIFTVIDVLVIFLLIFSPMLALLGSRILAMVMVFMIVLTAGLAYIVASIRIG